RPVLPRQMLSEQDPILQDQYQFHCDFARISIQNVKLLHLQKAGDIRNFELNQLAVTSALSRMRSSYCETVLALLYSSLCRKNRMDQGPGFRVHKRKNLSVAPKYLPS